MTRSPTVTSTGSRFPVCSFSRPLPTDSTTPSWGFSFAVSGRTVPRWVTSPPPRGRMTTRSASGRRFMSRILLSRWEPVSTRYFGVLMLPPSRAASQPKAEMPGSARQAQARVDLQAPSLPASPEKAPRRRDHGGVVSAQFGRRDHNPGTTRESSLDGGAQGPVACDAPSDCHRSRSGHGDGSPDAVDQVLHHPGLEARTGGSDQVGLESG